MSKDNGQATKEEVAAILEPKSVKNAVIQLRKDNLAKEFEAGQKMLTEFATKTRELESTLLRISGAIQICDEFLAAEQPQVKEG